MTVHEILREATGRGTVSGGGEKLAGIFEGGDTGGREVYGAAAVRKEACEQGKAINCERPVSMRAAKEIMRWAEAGMEEQQKVGRRRRDAERKAIKAAAARDGAQNDTEEERDWVDDVCTWERFQEALRRTAEVKGVGADGFNAYLLRQAAAALDTQEAQR